MLPRLTTRALYLAAVLANLLLPAGGASAQSSAPSSAQPGRHLEELLQQAWRWRSLQRPGAEPSFTSVRPWGETGLIALDREGLVAFDGYTWSTDPGWDRVPLTSLRAVIDSEEGVVVIGGSAIVLIDAAGESLTLGEVHHPTQISGLSHLPDGTPVVGTEGWIRRVTPRKLQPLYRVPAGSRLISGLGCDAEGNLLCATDRGIFRRVRDQWDSLAAPPRVERQDSVTFCLPVPTGLLLVPSLLDDLSEARLWDGQQLHTFRDTGQSLLISDVTATPAGELIAAVREPELRVWRDGEWHGVALPLPTSDAVQSLCMLGGGRLAVVFVSGRMSVCDLQSRRWEIHDPSVAGAHRLVSALAPSARGGIWLGTHRGVVRWDGSSFADGWTTAGQTDVPLDRVTAVCEDERGRVWVGSGSGFRGALCLDGESWSLHAAPEGVGERFVHAIRPVQGDLWFTLIGDPLGKYMQGGLVRLRGDDFTAFPTRTDGQELLRTYDVCSLPDGRIVASSSNDVLTLQNEGWLSLHPPLRGKQRGFSLFCAKDGALWVGFGAREPGALKLQGGRWLAFEDDTWRRAAAASFCESIDGRLWMASDFGLFLVDGDVCHEVGDRMLPARNFWQARCDGTGGLWLGGMGDGLVHFLPDDTSPPLTTRLDVAYTEEGHPVASWEAADSWNDTLPDQLTYVVSVDDLPVHPALRDRSLELGELPPGRHRLRVRAVDNLGNREVAGLEHDFDVHASIWASLPMLGAFATLGGALAWLALVLAHRRRERVRSERDRRELTLRLFSSQEDERRSLSRELHDDLGQLVTAICVDVQRAQHLPDAEQREPALQRALESARGTLERVHTFSSQLRPPVLDDLGLPQALQTALSDFSRRTGVEAQADIQVDGVAVSQRVSGHIYRILLESLTNIARHAGASLVNVTLRVSDGRIELTVSDDGAGFRPERKPDRRRFGVLGMRERADLLGGSFSLRSAPGQGTSIHVSIPLAPRHEEEGGP